MNQQQLIDKIEAATNGKVEEFKVLYKYHNFYHIGFKLKKFMSISSFQLLGFCDDFTFHIVEKDTIYVSLITTLLND